MPTGGLYFPCLDSWELEVTDSSRSAGAFYRDRHQLESAKSIIEGTFGEFLASKRQVRHVEAIELVRKRRDKAQQLLGFAARPFVLCGLPVRRPASSTLVYERRNGSFTLQITGHPQFGLPYGQDRLVPIFLATLAVRQQSQVIRFKSAAQMLDTFGMAKGGKEYRRLVAAFERIFGATIFFGTDTTGPRARVVQRSRFHFLREANIWYNRDRTQSVPGEEFGNTVVLSDEFFAEVMAHPIPVDIEVVKIFGSAPGALDLFVWLAYRCFVAKGEERIPLFGEYGLTAQLGSVEYKRPRRFRAMLEQWLAQVRTFWPECPATICKDREYLRLAPATAIVRRSG
jgi:hypothetical protein